MPLEKSAARRRAKTGAGRRAVQNREPKILENPKSLLVLKGHATSALISEVLSDIHILKKPDCRKLQRKKRLTTFRVWRRNASGEFVQTWRLLSVRRRKPYEETTS